MTLTVGSLFSGIGGLDLGLERAGMKVLWQCESDPYAQKVLKRHWPTTKTYDDVRRLEGGHARYHNLDRWHPYDVNVLAGGFPCQDLSDSSHGRGDGLNGPRSGLWREFDRLVGEFRPQFVIVENVDGAAWKRWVPVVRGDLFDRGYSTVPLRVRAEDVGAPFEGARVFVVAQAYREGEPASAVDAQMAELSRAPGPRRTDWGKPSSRALGVADGTANRMDRLRGAGNAVVPAVAEFVGRLVVNLAQGEPHE